jgi:hypothetical protein
VMLGDRCREMKRNGVSGVGAREREMGLWYLRSGALVPTELCSSRSCCGILRARWPQ